MSTYTELREEIAAALGDRWPVYAYMPDAIAGACLSVVPSEPALEPETSCAYTARFDVLCCAGRVAVVDAQRTLDEMVRYVIPQFVTNGVSVERGSADQMFTWGSVDYLSRRVTVFGMVTITPDPVAPPPDPRAPRLTRSTPVTGDVGRAVSVIGFNLADDGEIWFGPNQGTNYNLAVTETPPDTPGIAQAGVPAGTGVVDVRVVNDYGDAVLPGAFTYTST